VIIFLLYIHKHCIGIRPGFIQSWSQFFPRTFLHEFQVLFKVLKNKPTNNFRLLVYSFSTNIHMQIWFWRNVISLPYLLVYKSHFFVPNLRGKSRDATYTRGIGTVWSQSGVKHIRYCITDMNSNICHKLHIWNIIISFLHCLK
jgi:hypothetical protein